MNPPKNGVVLYFILRNFPTSVQSNCTTSVLKEDFYRSSRILKRFNRYNISLHEEITCIRILSAKLPNENLLDQFS